MDFQHALAPLEPVAQTPQNAADTGADGSAPNEGGQAPAGDPPAPAAVPPVPASALPTQSTTATAPAAATAPTEIPEDKIFGDLLDRMSGGIIKDVDGFKSVLPKLTQFPELENKVKDLTDQVSKAPKFANDEVKLYNTLVADGKTQEQLDQFFKINRLGDLNQLTPRDARIARMVLVDGVKPSVAELKVDRDFKLKDEDIDPTEREILDDDLRVASQQDREALKQFKAEVSATSTKSPEQLAIEQEVRVKEHTQAVKPYVTDLVSTLPHLGNYELTEAKDGQPGLSIELPITPEAKAEMGQFVENYFMDGLTPITKENTLAALSYARAEYFRAHDKEIFKSIADFLIPTITENVKNDFENRTGIKMPVDKPIAGNNPAAATAQFMQNVANRK